MTKTRSKPAYVLVTYYLHIPGDNRYYFWKWRSDSPSMTIMITSHIDKYFNVNHYHNRFDNDNDDHLSLRCRSTLVRWSEEKTRRLGKPSSAWSNTSFWVIWFIWSSFGSLISIIITLHSWEKVHHKHSDNHLTIIRIIIPISNNIIAVIMTSLSTSERSKQNIWKVCKVASNCTCSLSKVVTTLNI